MRGKLTLIVLLLLSCVGCDQISKEAATQRLMGGPVHSYFSDTFRFLYMENSGAFLGLGSNWPEFLRWGVFTFISGAAVVAATAWLMWRVYRTGTLQPYGQTFGLLLIASGGIGNLIDRVLRDGSVIDFMNVGIGPLRTGIFNVADVQIMLGLAVWLLWRKPVASAGPSPA